MKASTLFAITIAILVGLGAIVGAKYAGLFEPAKPVEEAKAAVEYVLVATQNLFEDTTVTASQVKIRPVGPGEKAHFDANKEKYLPPVTGAAHMRVLARDVPADAPLLKEYFLDLELPDAVTQRLKNPKMRAVNVSIPKERAGGGLLRKGEFVDVYLTTTIANGARPGQSTTQTAMIARNAEIIVKRNNLWTVMASNADDKPIDFTLKTNAYRAGLIEHSKGKGYLTLTPSVPDKQNSAIDKGIVAVSFSDPDSSEYRDEDNRIASVLAGELVIGDADLERVFKLKAIAPPPPEKSPVRIVRWNGNNLKGTTIFNPDGSAQTVAGAIPPAAPMNGNYGYSFGSPGVSASTSGAGGDCPTCNKNKH